VSYFGTGPSAITEEGVPRGNLSVRSLADIVSKDDLLQDSEYMQSVLVAVPKYLRDYQSTFHEIDD
jgi:hypothetical protein